MTGFSQSALLQALGWATLNSFWQVGVLWCAFALIRRYTTIAPGKLYALAVAALGLALFGFLTSLFLYLFAGAESAYQMFQMSPAVRSFLPAMLTAASISYLLLLAFPTARLVQNWRFLRRLRRSGLHKAPVQYRLYVKNIAGHLGIQKPVQVHFSALVNSPVTIGFLKPLILLPVASFNQLTVRQAEAILLHELAHIRRFDYLINLGITFTQTLLYFNPFVRLFVRAAETSREECCDGMVLQFGYDRIAYASALLQLEKAAAPLTQLALGATGKNQLLNRIQAILGQTRVRPALRLHHFTGMIASVLCVFALHSFFISGKLHDAADPMQAITGFANPIAFAISDMEAEQPTAKQAVLAASGKKQLNANQNDLPLINATTPDLWSPAPPPAPLPEDQIIHVAGKEQVALEIKEQQKVAEVVATTQKVLATLEWQQMEKDIADGLTEEEKAKAHQQYQEQVNMIDWKKMEQNIASNYHNTDWEKVNTYLQEAARKLHADSLNKEYNQALSQLETLRLQTGKLPLPDMTVKEIETIKLELRKVRDSLQDTRKRPVISL